ncbi:MAG: hypothetical protein UU34_C0008G0017 [Candidatus Curtissbacteria bacterium GW2011_GWA1_41_11]|uniref:Uncharacterized protein n=1 Tax=Candidatus Curtissbacteria bacterium GW2011_GWA1_41_11 TaxID=1618409 RepID=A0A0G0UDG7_9BACT|nr:MAG: hypothetical protein UU34_C0008G0017 [Candidatus Curtissbacteria bacterium GW2011_GWA1_41_11]
MNEAYIRKASLRARQKSKVLISRPDFQEDVIRLREKWKIPLEGIQSEDDYRKWQIELSQRTAKYLDEEWPKHRKEFDKLLKVGDLLAFESKEKELNNAAPLNALRIEIKSLLKKYALALRWEHPLKRYLLLNDVNNMENKIGVSIHGHTDSESGIEELSISIEEDTTLEDIKQGWPDIKIHQKSLAYRKQNKFQPIKNFDRDKRAYELQKEDKTTDEIGEIIQKEFNIDLDYNEIGIAINRYKKRLNIN